MRVPILNKKIKEYLFILLMIAAIVIIAIPRSLFGMDMEDEGWVLTAYQNIFSHPSSVSYNFLYYNGIVAGGAWNFMFGQYGLVAFRVMYVLLEIMKALLVYFILRDYCNKYAIGIGLIIYEIIIRAYYFTNHNQVSAVLCLLAILFIIKSLEKKRWWMMLIGGIVVGINVFTRLPNIALCALIFVLAYYWCDTHDNNGTLILFVSALGGFALGCIGELLLMCSLGHFDIFIDNVASGFAASSDSDSTHNLLSMGKVYLVQLSTIWLQIAIFSIACGISLLVMKKIQNKHSKTYYVIAIILSFITFILAYTQHRVFIEERLFVLQTLICFYIIFHESSHIKYISLLSLLFLYIMPLGSDYGYDSSIIYQAMSLSFPLVIAYAITEFGLKLRQHGIINMLPIYIVMLVMIGYPSYNRGRNWLKACHELLINNERYEIHSPLATTIFDTNWFTKINPLLDEMAKYVQPGDVVLCFQSAPMVHYLTQTQPYLENAWPWTYTSAEMERHFVKAHANSDALPLIVREKGWILDIFNVEDYPDWDNSKAAENRFHQNKKIKLIQEFIEDNGYFVVWEDKAFQILLPPDI